MDPRKLLAEQWKTIERIIASIARKRGLSEGDADAFASLVKVRLFENDCAIVRNFRNESKFTTYLTVVIHRLLGDFSVSLFGKWHASAAATRLGPLALDLERMIYREGAAVDEAIARLRAAHPDVNPHDFEELLENLPSRRRRHSTVSIEGLDELAAADSADVLVVDQERRRLGERTADLVRGFLRRLEHNDRLMLQFHFESDMQLSQVARILGIPQKPLYRRRDQLLRELRDELALDGITAAEVADLIGHLPEAPDLGLRIEEFRLTDSEEELAADPEYRQ